MRGRVKPSSLKAITAITPVMLRCGQSGLRVASFLPAWKKQLIGACAVGAVEPRPPLHPCSEQPRSWLPAGVPLQATAFTCFGNSRLCSHPRIWF